MTFGTEPSSSGSSETGALPSKDKQNVPLAGYVGFDSITTQIQKKFLKRGFQLNIMLVGESGLGKSTFVNTLFSSHLLDSKGRKDAAQPDSKTTTIESVSHILEENGVKLRLNVIDTPGYGDQINNDKCWEPIVNYIKDQHSLYLKKELNPTRERIIDDTRVHLCLFFLSPTGHAFKPIDLLVLQKLVKVVNVVPVIAKSDSLTPPEREAFKNRIQAEIAFHGIDLYPYESPEDDEEDIAANQAIRDELPFAIVGSELIIEVDGKQVRGRKTRWGAINVEDPAHCEFVQLREFITRTHLQDLIETTHFRHYESHRLRQIKSFSEAPRQPAPPQKHQPPSVHSRPSRPMTPVAPMRNVR